MQDYKARRPAKRRPRSFTTQLRGRLHWLKRRRRRPLPKGFPTVPPLPAAPAPAAAAGRPSRFPAGFAWRRLLDWTYAAIVAGVLGGALVQGWSLSQASLQQVRVSGAVSLDPVQVVRMSGLAAGMRLRDVDPYAVSSRLRQDPRVDAVDARRVYPHTLWIDVRERSPDARVLLDDGQAALVDPHNVVIRLEPSRAGDLPLIRGAWGAVESVRGSAMERADSARPGAVLQAAGLTRARVFLTQARHAGVTAFDRAILDVSDPQRIVVTGGAAPRLVFPVEGADAVLRVYRQLTGPDAPATVAHALSLAGEADFRFAQEPDGGRVYLIP